MLLRFNASRLAMRLQREKDALARTLGRKRRTSEKDWRKIQIASDYLRQARETLTHRSLPAVWDIALLPQSTSRPNEARVGTVLCFRRQRRTNK